MASCPQSLTEARHFLTPAIGEMVAKAKHQRNSTVIDADLHQDFMWDGLILVVKHRLCSRDEIEDRKFYVIGQRIGDALGLKEALPAKTRRVERRQLMWRGEQAKRSACKPVKTIKKRRA